MRQFLLAVLLIVPSVFIASCNKDDDEMIQSQYIKTNAFTVETECPIGEDEDPQPMISGAVMNGVTSQPVYPACVELRTTSNMFVAITGTNALGHYFFNSVANGSYNLLVYVGGVVVKTVPITVSGSPQVFNITIP